MSSRAATLEDFSKLAFEDPIKITHNCGGNVIFADGKGTFRSKVPGFHCTDFDCMQFWRVSVLMKMAPEDLAARFSVSVEEFKKDLVIYKIEQHHDGWTFLSPK